MGIKNLLPELRGCTDHVHISQFRGKKVAVDGFTWLHRSVFACSKELFHNPATERILPFLVKRLNILLNNGLQPIFVFDGRPLPIKSATDLARRQIRENARQRILKAEREGRPIDCYNEAISIKFETVTTFINYLKTKRIPFIVAPYEADAQLAYLARTKQVDLVLTEDSDLIAYGTPQVLFKMNDEGYVDSIKYADALRTLNYNSHDEFLTFCILSGCDYAPAIRMMGVKTANDYVHRLKNINVIMNTIKTIPKFGIPPDYHRAFEKAFITFRHQKVYDLRTKSIVPLNPTNREFDFAGETFYGEELEKHVNGLIDSRHTAPEEENQEDYDDQQSYFEEEENENEYYDDNDDFEENYSHSNYHNNEDNSGENNYPSVYSSINRISYQKQRYIQSQNQFANSLYNHNSQVIPQNAPNLRRPQNIQTRSSSTNYNEEINHSNIRRNQRIPQQLNTNIPPSRRPRRVIDEIDDADELIRPNPQIQHQRRENGERTAPTMMSNVFF
ncbi:XPG I-region family protein [Tritrichomonas foetus]|uniref:XPG I-region family protein n=1 Tax=Tritrichomonas foetus TaxID=1144522 RepID=A0A1J4KSA7_9EUKA|nr:XPG I-region family protein [Tritrichomonas foetus]|eukprot:OHT12550.1 XPG I-region family protein [Tritrichomonas foetus]